MNLSTQLARTPTYEPPAVPALNLVTSSVGRILNRWPDVVANPPESDRERLVQQMRDRVSLDDWQDARMSFVTAAARALFDANRRERDDLRSLRLFYCREIEASTSSTFLGAMTSVYLGSYVPGEAHTRALSKSLKASKDRLGSRWKHLLNSVPDVLDPTHAPDSISRLMTNMSDPWTDLKAMGIRSPHAPGLMDFVHLAYVKQLRPTLRHRVQLDKLLNWLKPEGQPARMSGASEAINAILEHRRRQWSQH